ncbi:MAG: response regulator, partial [Bacteroidota bacterium]|nr:response regulator [Bacteroidota bacterium]
YPKEIADIYHQSDQLVFQTGLPQINREDSFIDDQNKKRFILTSKIPIKNENGEIIGLVGIDRDITKQKMAEETVKYERNLLRTLIDNLPDAVYVKDKDFRKIIANTTEVKFMGFESEDEVLGKSDYEVYTKEVADSSFTDDKYVFTSGQPQLNKEGFFIDNQNKKHWTLNSKVPIRDEKGMIIGLVGIGKDITDRKDEEFRLKLFESVITNATDAVAVTEIDPNDVHNHKIIFVNESYTKMTGYSKEDVIGKSPSILQGPKTDKTELARVAEYIKNYQPCEFEVINYKKNGEEFWSAISISPITDGNKNYTHWIAIKRDITEHKKIEQELIKAKEKAESGSKAKSEFLANMSHEIRTPLNSVIGFSDLLHKSKLDDIQRQYVSAVFNSANSLLDIINEILDFSKIEAGKLEIENEKTDIFELGYQVADVISYQAYKKDLELLLNIGLDVPRFIWTDAVRIRQVLINLLGNAVKFTTTGEVELKIEILQKDIEGKSIFRFSVRDTGIGINPENQQKIFEAFSQEDASINRKFGGTGLGLAISRRLINLMGSELKLESTPQVGSTFYFDLKLKAMDGEAIEWKNLYEYKKVLIVDDNVNNRHILKDMLALRLINCDEAENGLEACNKLEAGNKYDLVLMDYHMPVMDGITAIEKIRNELKLTELPIMLLHSSADDASINSACQELNVHQRLVKPIKIENLFDSLSKIGISNNQRKIKLKEIDVKQPAHLKEYKVLVVDDNMFNILLIKTIITQILPNAQISEASNGNEAVELYRSVQPDIIFMDIQMPEMNGYDAAKVIRSIEKLNRIPIIALTAGTLKDEKERCLEAGMNDYVSKPFVSSTIVSAIDKWLVSTFEKSFVI